MGDVQTMDSSQKKNAILIGVAALLLIGALVFGFRDSIFGGGQAPAIDEAATSAAAAAVGIKDGNPEPDSPNPPPRGSGKRPVTGN